MRVPDPAFTAMLDAAGVDENVRNVLPHFEFCMYSDDLLAVLRKKHARWRAMLAALVLIRLHRDEHVSKLFRILRESGFVADITRELYEGTGSFNVPKGVMYDGYTVPSEIIKKVIDKNADT